jgi:ATP-dependent helicase Lhr and Lhr-like helicase
MEKILPEFLGELERKEAQLLSWGVVDGHWEESELEDNAEAYLDREDAWHVFGQPRDLINTLLERGLLFRWDESGDYCYRTRFAESLRLLARLRQLFPKHLRNVNGWQSASTLVADFRLLLRARKYPKRDRPALEVVEECCGDSSTLNLSSLQQAAFRSMLGITEESEGWHLGGFQARSALRILQAAQHALPISDKGKYPTGSVVCAGTGSGKTLAFYLPAFTHLAGMVESDSSKWTRALALYPRNELLKDQFTETCRMARVVNPLLKAAGRRAITIGAFFGPTLTSAKDLENDKPKWERFGEGYVCPFIQCPDDKCPGDMIWLDSDVISKKERLVCNCCSASIEEDEIVLTRGRMKQSPPDILFTTTEMLNRRMTDSRLCHLFGIGTPAEKKPELVLLDEVHTYSGTHGAQVAYLLRRWRHRAKCKPHYVGLSATLREASSFFAKLVGIYDRLVEEVSPLDAEMMEEGMEYSIAVRGDPVSGASLLSTTIQTAMLMRRCLDPRSRALSQGVYGKKIFVFTDNLDVTNRLFFNLLDAEGLNARGQPDFNRHPGGSLANLRASDQSAHGLRYLYGQSWDICESIGHVLDSNEHLQVARVSSQDSGVDGGADILAATASLEVGFNDPEVGAVIQHKAPQDSAAFLQRKGRSGRKREMRPWTVVVLSDYGRDRIAYQGYDVLFDPELKPRELPLANRHVLKMQAVYSMMDWLSSELGSTGPGHFWNDASGPTEYPNPKRRQQKSAEILSSVIVGGPEFDRLRDWLKYSLGLRKPEQVESLLWEAPRALMTSVIPTLLRRFETKWLSRDKVGGEYHVGYPGFHPLPEFIPASLFSDLNLPEVAIWVVQRMNGPEEVNYLPAAQALREFAPGRISRRYGVWHGLSRHWIGVDPSGGPQQCIPIDSFCSLDEREEIGVFPYRGDNGQLYEVTVFRPFALHVGNDAEQTITDSSNAMLKWRSQILPPVGNDSGLELDLPKTSEWTPVIEGIRFFTHRLHQPVRVTRFTLGSKANLRFRDGEEHEIDCSFTTNVDDEPCPAALGFGFDADAIRVQVKFPNEWSRVGPRVSAQKMPSLKSEYFKWRMLDESRFDGVANVFQRQWFATIILSAINSIAIEKRKSLEDSWAELQGGQALSLSSVLEVIFQSVVASEENTPSDEVTQLEQSRQTELRELLAEDSVREILNDLVPLLWSDDSLSSEEWLRQKYLATFGAAFRDSIQVLCPDIDVDDLVVDLHPGVTACVNADCDSDSGEIWLSETSPGGGGVVERLLPQFAEEPRRFLDILKGTLGRSDFEIVDVELKRFLAWLEYDSELQGLVSQLRSSSTQNVLTTSFENLRSALKRKGLQTTHSVITTMSARLLRPGSNSDTDTLIRGIMQRWSDEEARLGVEIEPRALAYALSASDALDQALGGVLPLGPGQVRRQWRFVTIAGLLWARGTQARNHALELRNPYAEVLRPERFLVLDALATHEIEVLYDSVGWESALTASLINTGRSVLCARVEALEGFRLSLLVLLSNPIDTGTLLLYPRFRAVARDNEYVRVTLELVTPGEVTTDAVMEDNDQASARLIVKTMKGSRDEVRDLLESLIATELLFPSREIWLVSPWVTDLPLLDNRAGAYSGIEPGWPKCYLRFADLLAYSLKSSPHTQVKVVTRSDEHNKSFCNRLIELCRLDGTSGRLKIDSGRDELHIKGFAGESFSLKGSMNFTYNGIEVLEETVELEIDPERASKFLFELSHNYFTEGNV